MTIRYEIAADIIRKKFNYGFNHIVNLPDTDGGFRALVDRYNLLTLDLRVSNGRIHFTKPDDLNYSIVIFGSNDDLNRLVEFLKNPSETEPEMIEVITHSVSVGDFY